MSNQEERPKVLVTGGVGYIGSHTVIELLDSGFEVYCIDSMERAFPFILDQLQHYGGNHFHFEQLDMRDEKKLSALIGGISNLETVIHFAAYKSVEESVKNPTTYYQNNIGSLLNLLKAMKSADVPHLVFSGSCTVYGIQEELPVTEKADLQQAESPYGMTKQMGEWIINDAVSAGEIAKASILRYFNPLGASEKVDIGEVPIGTPQNLLPYLMKVAYGELEVLEIFGDDYATRDGSCIRDFIHVCDLAKAHVDALKYFPKQEPALEVFNIGSGNGVTVFELVKAFEEANGIGVHTKIGERRKGDIPAMFASCEKAEKQMGWKAEHNLVDMLRSAWAWQQKLAQFQS